MGKVLYIVDAPSLIFQVYYAIRTRAPLGQRLAQARSLTTPDGRPCGAVYGFTQDMLHVHQELEPDYLVCVFDAPGPTFREAQYELYKANRPPMPDDLRPQWAMIHQLLEALRVPALELAGFEADDLAASLAGRAVQEGLDVVIVTSDKDARQLIGPHCRLLNLRTEKFFDKAALEQDWGIRPEQVADFLALVGDPVDNVPGVPGIGPKTAGELLRRYGNLENILEHLSELPGPKAEGLRHRASELLTFRDLLRLRTDVPLDLSWEVCRRQEPDAARLAALFREWGFRKWERIWGERAASQLASAWKFDILPLEEPTDVARLLQEARRTGWLALAAHWEPSEEPLRAALQTLVFTPDGRSVWTAPMAGLSPGTRQALEQLLGDPSLGKVAHDAKSLLLAARRFGLLVRGLQFDVAVADYLLEPGTRAHGLAALCVRHLNTTLTAPEEQPRRSQALLWPSQAQDTELCRRAVATFLLRKPLLEALQKANLWSLYEELENPLIEVLADLEWRGIKVNLEALEFARQTLGEKLHQLESQIFQEVGRVFSLQSPKQLREVLFEELRLPVLRRTSTGPSTDQEVLERLAQHHSVPRIVLEHRHLSKIMQYVEALPKQVHPETGRIHARLDQTVAATGRLISSSPNLQNIPIRSAEGRKLRAAFVASGLDWVLLDADYSQIELRLLAHLSGDPVLWQAFREGRDIHRYVAAELSGLPEERVTPELRERAKAINFGIIYGMSAVGLAARTGLSEDEADAYIRRFFERHPGVDEFVRRVFRHAAQHGEVRTLLGRRRRITGVRSHASRPWGQPEREAINTVVQGSAADLIKKAMVSIYRAFQEHSLPGGMVLQIHDELVFDIPSSSLAEIAPRVKTIMQEAIPLQVPVAVDLSVGPNWLDLEPWEPRPEKPS